MPNKRDKKESSSSTGSSRSSRSSLENGAYDVYGDNDGAGCEDAFDRFYNEDDNGAEGMPTAHEVTLLRELALLRQLTSDLQIGLVALDSTSTRLTGEMRRLSLAHDDLIYELNAVKEEIKEIKEDEARALASRLEDEDQIARDVVELQNTATNHLQRLQVLEKQQRRVQQVQQQVQQEVQQVQQEVQQVQQQVQQEVQQVQLQMTTVVSELTTVVCDVETVKNVLLH